MFTVGVFAIIFDDERRVLLCHRRDFDLWNLPGGGLERGETPGQGVVREVEEETGLLARVEHLAGVYSKPDVNEIVFSFICSVVGGQIALTPEADALEYFRLEAIPANTSPKQVERIRDAVGWAGTTLLKTQTGPSGRPNHAVNAG